MSSNHADAPQMHSVTHSSIIPSAPFWGSKVLLTLLKGCCSSCINRKEAAWVEAIRIISFPSFDYGSSVQE